MKNRLKKLNLVAASLFLILAFVPLVTFGQTGTPNPCQSPAPGGGVAGMIDYVTCVLGKSILYLLFALAVLYFMWGVVQYGFSEEEAQRDKAKQIMTFGIIALTVMFSVYGLIRVVQTTFGLTSTNNPVSIPVLPK